MWRWVRKKIRQKKARVPSRHQPHVDIERLESRLALTAEPVLVRDIYPGSSEWAGSSISELTAVDSILYFTADDGISGEELWKTDGTVAGTVRVKDINPGNASSSPTELTAIGSTLYFIAYDGTTAGQQLWKTDGTAAGTTRITQFQYRSGLLHVGKPAELTAVGDTLYFTSYDALVVTYQPFYTVSFGLWKTDGSTNGTVRVITEINSGTGVSQPHSPRNLTAVGSTLYFRASDDLGTELWKTDGTTNGTILVKDLKPDGNSFSGSFPENLTAVGTTLYFSTNDTNGTSGYELWKTDGTAEGTVRLKDFSGLNDPQNFTAIDSILYFTADDGTSGEELWKTDGTVAGTKPFNINTYTDRFTEEGSSHGSYPENLYAIGSELYFTARTGQGFADPRVLCKTDGTSVETVPSMETILSFYPGDEILPVGEALYFAGTYSVGQYGGTGSGLWKTDGTEAGPILIKNFYPRNLTAVGSTLYFTADDGTSGDELWKLDTYINEPPTNILLSNHNIVENYASGSSIGIFTTTDPDAGNTFTYSLVAGAGSTNNASFTIVGNQLRAAEPFNFEAKNTYVIRVRSTDQGGLFFEKQFTITVLDVNEPPASVSLVNFLSELSETTNTSTETKLADIQINDDALGSNTLSLSGTDGDLFQLNTQGSLFLKAGVSLNYSTKPRLFVTVSARDNSITDSSPVTVSYALDIKPRSPHLMLGTNGQLFVAGQPVTHDNLPVTSSFHSWTIFEAACIRGQNLVFGQHSTGLIHRLYADVDWSLEAGLNGFGSAYSIYLPRSARGPNFPVNQEPEPMPADLLIPLEISDTQLRIDPVGQLHADDIMLTRTGSSDGIKYTDLVGYSPIAVKGRTLLWQHRTNRSFVEWKFNSSLVYQFSYSLYAESYAGLELTYQLDINRDGRIGHQS